MLIFCLTETNLKVVPPPLDLKKQPNLSHNDAKMSKCFFFYFFSKFLENFIFGHKIRNHTWETSDICEGKKEMLTFRVIMYTIFNWRLHLLNPVYDWSYTFLLPRKPNFIPRAGKHHLGGYLIGSKFDLFQFYIFPLHFFCISWPACVRFRTRGLNWWVSCTLWEFKRKQK